MTRDNYAMKTRVDDTISWLSDDDFDLVMLYFDDPDETLHWNGIGDQVSIDNLYEVDEAIGYLFEVIHANDLDGIVNVIIVSDHGHITQKETAHVCIYDYVNETDVEFLVAGYGPTFQLLPVDGKLDEVKINNPQGK